jgi:hypothetical protein
MRLALPYFRSECRARVENLVPNLSAQKRGKMGHPFVWLGWETQGPSTALGMTDCFRGRARAHAPHGLFDGDLVWRDIISTGFITF